jgi:uncharacterized protein (DUF58 family)
VREQAQRDAHGLRVRARRDVSELLAGAYRSAFRGRGLAFEELRDYNPGDDAGMIEWNATARLGRPIVKRMREERDLVLGLLVDISDSLDFGSGGETKRGAACRAAAALAAAAVASHDRLALATFGAGVQQSLRPAAGALQLERAFRALAQRGGGEHSDAGAALAWATDSLPRHAVVILISDLFVSDPGAALARCARKHDLVVLRVVDPADTPPKRCAPIRVRGAEGGRRTTWRPRRRDLAIHALDEHAVRRRGADYGEIATGPALIGSLHHFFERRSGRTS